MAMHPVRKEQCEEAVAALKKYGSRLEAARSLHLHESTFKNRVRVAEVRYGIKVPAYVRPEPKYGTEEFTERKLIDELKQKLEAITKENKHLTETAFNFETMKAFIHECKRYQPKVPKWTIEAPKKGAMGTPVLVVSDWHWGETVSASQMNGVNAYNKQIATVRMKRMFSKSVELWTHYIKTPVYDRFVMPMLGDMLSGNIHEELTETNWDQIFPCSWHLAEQLIAGIDLLLDSFGRLYIPCVVGNHGRIHKKPRYKFRQIDSYEWNLYHILARHYRLDDRVFFDIADSSQLAFDIYQTKFVASHGDEYRGGGGISGSWSPIVRGDAKQRVQAMAIAKPYQYRLIGHWHIREEVQDVRKNGSGKGFDEMALQEGYKFQLPQQDMFLVHQQMGITFEAPVYLETPGTTFDLRTDEPRMVT